VRTIPNSYIPLSRSPQQQQQQQQKKRKDKRSHRINLLLPHFLQAAASAGASAVAVWSCEEPGVWKLEQYNSGVVRRTIEFSSPGTNKG
jgi:hypothetical protein